MLRLQHFKILDPKYALTCSLELPNQDFVVGDTYGNLVLHRRHHANVIIHKYSGSAVSALAFLSQSKQYVSAHTDGYLRFRNFENGAKREIKIGYTVDFLAELSNGSLLIKGKHGTFAIYDTQNYERIRREDVTEKFLARIRNTDDFIFQDPVGSLFIMQMTGKGFVWQSSIILSKHDNTEIQALHMLSQAVGVMVKSEELVLCKLNGKSFIPLSTAQYQGPYIDFHLLSPEGLSDQAHAFCVTSRGVRVIDLSKLFPNLWECIDMTDLWRHNMKKGALQFSYHPDMSDLLNRPGLLAHSNLQQAVTAPLKSKL